MPNTDGLTLQVEDIESGRRFRIGRGAERLSFRELFGLLQANRNFADWYTRILSECEFPAFYWEHPPLMTASIDREAEFVLIEAPLLTTLVADASPFEAHFARQSGRNVVTFSNLGGDALLIVPRPVGARDAYPHLATFVRSAPGDQVRELWRRTAKAVFDALSPTPRWLSTAGLGVSWLHLRLDTRPKYYSHGPYRSVDFFTAARP